MTTIVGSAAILCPPRHTTIMLIRSFAVHRGLLKLGLVERQRRSCDDVLIISRLVTPLYVHEAWTQATNELPLTSPTALLPPLHLKQRTYITQGRDARLGPYASVFIDS
jgi:hypothetical protein